MEIVRQGYASFAENGVEGVIPFFTEDAVIYSIPEWPDDPGTTGMTASGSSPGNGWRTSTTLDSIFAKSMTEGRPWLPSFSSPDRPRAPASR